MAFASVGTLGTRANTGNNQASSAITTSAAAEAGNLVVLLIAVDANSAGADGDDLAVASVSDSAGGNTWLKGAQFANTQGALAAGTSCSIWYSKLTNTIASGGTITATFTTAANSDESAMSAWEFTVGGTVAIEGTPGVLANDGAAQGSLNVTTANIECLRIRVVASESATATALTKTAAFTSLFTQALSGGSGVAAQGIRGEWLISTSTGQASAPTGGAGAVDHASVYVAFKEVIVATGTLAGTDGADASAITGNVAVQGSFSGTEAADAAAISGDIVVQGTAAATEGADSAAVAGDVIVQGTATSVEGADAAEFAGTVAESGGVTGTVAAMDGADLATFSGNVIVQGASGATEGADAASLAGNVIIGGVLSAPDGADVLALAGDVIVGGQLVAGDGPDAAALGGKIIIQGLLLATDGADAARLVAAPAGDDPDPDPSPESLSAMLHLNERGGPGLSIRYPGLI